MKRDAAGTSRIAIQNVGQTGGTERVRQNLGAYELSRARQVPRATPPPPPVIAPAGACALGEYWAK